MELFEKEWEGFEGEYWRTQIDVRDFIQNNYTPYLGDESFLANKTPRTQRVLDALNEKLAEERCSMASAYYQTSQALTV